MSDEVDRTGPARDELYQSIAIRLLNAGIVTPAADFVAEVRREAGFRASPRQIRAALDGLVDAEEEVSVEAVTGLVSAARGNRSQRQRRRAPEWQALGTALALQGQDGSPVGQRDFIGTARQIAGPHATDALLLKVSLALAGEGFDLDIRTVARIAKRLARSAEDLSDDQLTSQILREFSKQQRDRASRPRQRSSVGARREQMHHPARFNKPGKRRWKPGGRRRRTIQFPKTDDQDG